MRQKSKFIKIFVDVLDVKENQCNACLKVIIGLEIENDIYTWLDVSAFTMLLFYLDYICLILIIFIYILNKARIVYK